MMLSSELFGHVAASLLRGVAPESFAPDADANGASGDSQPQRRRGPRVAAAPETEHTARLIPLTDTIAPGPIDVTLRDVAPGGARFLHTSRIPLDEQFVLVLPSTDGPVAVLCGVAYWQPVAENLFAIGAKFTRVIRHGNPAHSRTAPTPVSLVAVRRAV